MKPVACALLSLVLLGFSAASLPSCSVDHASDAIACTVQSDCAADRTCTDGYCVVGATANCPPACTSCDVAAKTCAITGNRNVTCPTGYHCTIGCGNDACRDVNCMSAASCVIQCSGAKSCEKVTCAGDCAITCSGVESCKEVDCRSACACDVTCPGAQSCSATQCPSSCGGNGNNSCTSEPPSCNRC